ncbi:hypothetical protein [Alicyclobacillus sp. SO9]|uniref:hypothetical protein n=1 Tax=Alicyclobacillus sp. SO9 TaxID=2665646 RepID=UPI0018E6ED61|nr:hypothetical protein [Alicyclobacillus sp. SO9]QQE80535.1 hypothetical protein GI364_09065 [Alicyclobacillus sp. SO9]
MKKPVITTYKIREASRKEPGWWVGAPSATYVEGYGFLLGYRLRGGDGRRGYENRLAFSQDGISFEDIVVFEGKALSTRSMERPCIRKIGDEFICYLSYVDSETDRWKIDFVTSDSPEKLDIKNLRPALNGSDCNAEAVKDPYVVVGDGNVNMYVSYAQKVANINEIESDIRDSGDVFTIQSVLSRTGLATSTDGKQFTWSGSVLNPRPNLLDSHTARLSGIIPFSPKDLVFYDANTDEGSNYEEEATLAIMDSDTEIRPLGRLESWISQLSADRIRYVDPILVNNNLYVYYERTTSSGAHDLCVSVMRWGEQS